MKTVDRDSKLFTLAEMILFGDWMYQQGGVHAANNEQRQAGKVANEYFEKEFDIDAFESFMKSSPNPLLRD